MVCARRLRGVGNVAVVELCDEMVASFREMKLRHQLKIAVYALANDRD